ncbi:MAG: 2'-deoxycytidine 5'-triphosphate deaminase [Pseudomonadota bacterium]
MTFQAGILSDSAIEALIASGAVKIAVPLAEAQIQPASLDLRLGEKAYRVRASFLPGARRTVAERLKDVTLHEFDITNGAVLETGCVYIVPLLESFALPKDISASTNPKSSTGRLDIFTRIITDRATRFDQLDAGYTGPLYAEISPSTFPILVRTGSRLAQIRFRAGEPRLNDNELKALHAKHKLVDQDDAILVDGLALSVDLSSFDNDNLIGYRAKRHAGLIDVDKRGGYEASDFWEPIYASNDKSLVLDPRAFYILASKEAVHVPPETAAEMVAFDPLVGEFRVHYAGFFDPGFGHSAAGGSGARAVLEVRSYEVPFIIEHGQVIGRLVYERMRELPKKLYGQDLKSNYQAQGLKLSKHFC